MKRVSNHALLFIGAGLYLALGGLIDYSTVNAILLLWIAIDRFRLDRNRLAMILIVICTVVLVVKQIGLVFIIVLISLGIYYMKAPRPAFGRQMSRGHRLMLKLRQDQPSWVLQSISNWHVFGEVRMDLSVAVPEERETTIVLQGIVGDVDLIVPEDYGLEVEASVMIGQAGLNDRREGGLHQQIRWRSPDYETKGQKVKLQLFYLVGNIRIRPI